jgi:phosphoserine aminotransferase
MKPIILAPGPTKCQPELMQWLQDADTEGVFWRSHRSPWFEVMFQEIKDGLRSLLGIPSDYTIAFTTSANEVWERSIESLVERESFHIVGGEFAERWFQYSKKLGRSPSRFDYDQHFSGSFGEIEVPESAEVICLTQNETALGFWTPEFQISELASRYPDKLMLVDVVSGIPQTNLPWHQVDLAYWSIQKGFQLPAGLGVAVFSPRTVERCQSLSEKQSTGAFHSFAQLAAHSAMNLTAETPNVLAIYLLKRAIQKYLEIGVETIRKETLKRAEVLYQGISQTSFKPLVTDQRYQSPTVAAAIHTSEILDWRASITKSHGIYTGACYSELKPYAFRVANFPIHTEEELLAVIEQMKMFRS